MEPIPGESKIAESGVDRVYTQIHPHSFEESRTRSSRTPLRSTSRQVGSQGKWR